MLQKSRYKGQFIINCKERRARARGANTSLMKLTKIKQEGEEDN